MLLVLSLIFGAVGTVYMGYGKRQHSPMYLVTGFALLIYPYLFSNAWLIILIGVLISLIPLAVAKGWI